MAKKAKTVKSRKVQLDSFQTFKKRFASQRTHDNATWLLSATHWLVYFKVGDKEEVSAVLHDIANFWEVQ